MLNVLIVAGIFVCAIMAVRSARLLTSALWLAGTSALVALIMFLLGAPEVAVIELSVGAGLVTVLFVFAISIAGEESLPRQSLLPRPLAWTIVIITFLLLAWQVLPSFNLDLPFIPAARLSSSLWQDRSLDIMLQVVIIFAGVLGVLGLLGGKSQEGEGK